MSSNSESHEERAPKRRSRSFTRKEDAKILEAYKQHKNVIDAKLSLKVSSREKHQTCEKIVDRVNADNPIK